MSERVRGGRTLHPELTPADRRRLLTLGVKRFNRGEFFAAHEAFEEIWRSTTPEPRDLFQGLVQVAAGLHHGLDRGKSGPARRVMARGRRRLEPLGPVAGGIDLATLLVAVEAWEAWFAGSGDQAPPLPTLQMVGSERLG